MLIYLGLLRDHRLRTIWLGETVNAFGSGLTFWALAWLLYRQYPEASQLAGALLAVLSAASVVGTLTLGALLDRLDRRRTLMAVNLSLALLTALLAWAVGLASVWPLFALVSLSGLLSGLPGAALSATLPSLVPETRWQATSALFNFTWMAGELLAAAMAGVLIAALSARAALIADAATFAFAALAYASVRFPGQLTPGKKPGLAAWWAQLKEGWRFVGVRPSLWGTFLGLGAQNAFFGVFGALLLPRVGERLLGAQLAPVGVGALDSLSVGCELLGALWLGRMAVPERAGRRLILAGCTVPVLAGVGVVLAPNFTLALVLGAVQGFAFAALSVLVFPLVARQTPEELRGRVFAVRAFAGQVGRPLALLGGGAALAALGTAPLAVVFGGGAAVLAGFGYWRGRGDARLSARRIENVARDHDK